MRVFAAILSHHSPLRKLWPLHDLFYLFDPKAKDRHLQFLPQAPQVSQVTELLETRADTYCVGMEATSRVRQFACHSGNNGVLEVEQREVASTSDMTFIEA